MGCSAVVVLLLQACATSAADGEAAQAGSQSCPPGEIVTCDVRATGRISDGRFGRNRQGPGWRKNCGCEPERNLEDLEGASLPQPH